MRPFRRWLPACYCPVPVLTQTLVLPLFGLEATMSTHLAIGGIFTLVSLVRGYALRRAFEALHQRRAPPLFGAAQVRARVDQASMHQRRS